MRHVSAFLPVLFIFIYLGMSSSKGDDATYAIGSLFVHIPPPEKFYRCDGKSDKVDRLLNSFIAPGNRDVAVFCDENDLAKVMGDQTPSFGRYFTVQVRQSLENEDITNSEFASVQNKLKESVGDVIAGDKGEVDKKVESESEMLSKAYNVSLNMKVGDIQPLGVYNETTQSSSFCMLEKVEIKVSDLQSKSIVMIAAGSLVHINKHLLYFYAFTSYQDQSDFMWARTSLKTWTDALIAANAGGSTQ